MPIYEYSCLDCRKRVNIFFRSMAEASDAADDDRLEEAFAKTPHLVLASDIVPGPTPRSMRCSTRPPTTRWRW